MVPPHLLVMLGCENFLYHIPVYVCGLGKRPCDEAGSVVAVAVLPRREDRVVSATTILPVSFSNTCLPRDNGSSLLVRSRCGILIVSR